MSRETISARLTRPSDTTAYASGDLVANSTTAGSVVALPFTVPGGPFQIRRVRLEASKADVTNAAFRLHLYSSAPTVTNGDNAAFSSIRAGWLGSIDVTVSQLFSDGAVGVATTEVNCNTAPGTLYGLLEARGAYTPASAGTFTVALEVAYG